MIGKDSENDNQFRSSDHALAYENGREYLLPQVNRLEVRNQSDYYGISDAFIRFAGRNPGKWRLPWLWQHGWIPEFAMVDPLVITATNKGLERDKPWLVSGIRQKEFLIQHGFEKVEAVGLPILYARPPSVNRIAGSLLVMPHHSSKWVVQPERFRNYIDAILEFKPFFSKIVFCLHENCLNNGLWVRELRECGIPFVLGASISDRNSLSRTALLFQQFETVVANGFGSHLIQASYFGAKVSIFGDYPRYDPKHFKNEPLYAKFPHLLKSYLPLFSEESIREKLDFLFCNPTDAKVHLDWGRREIGCENVVTPKMAPRYLSRTKEPTFTASNLKQKGKRCAWKALSLVPDPLETRISCIVSKSYRDEYENDKRYEGLRTLPRFTPGKINLDGRNWSYADAPSFYDAYQAIYRRKCFELRLDHDEPVIIDIGAQVGIACRFLKEKFPKSEIVAVEADKNLIQPLNENLKDLGNPPVRILHAAVRENDGGVNLQGSGAIVGHVRGANDSENDGIKAPSTTLNDLVGNRMVDFLKIDIKDAEVCVLKIGRDALKWVNRISVKYHSRADQQQDLAEILLLLRDAGFRVWLDSEHTPKHPFVRRPLSCGMDLQLNITGMKKELL